MDVGEARFSVCFALGLSCQLGIRGDRHSQDACGVMTAGELYRMLSSVVGWLQRYGRWWIRA